MADGRIIVSADSGVTWQPDQRIGQSGAVTAFWVNPADPRIALAVLLRALMERRHSAARAPHDRRRPVLGRYFRESSRCQVHGVTADPAGNAVYVATDQGVFFARTNLNVLSVAPPSWTALAGLLPVSPRPM